MMNGILFRVWMELLIPLAHTFVRLVTYETLSEWGHIAAYNISGRHANCDQVIPCDEATSVLFTIIQV